MKPEAIQATKIKLPPGATISELDPKKAYVLQFEKPVPSGEEMGLVQYWSGLFQAGFCGPVIILSDGSRMESLEEYAERYHQRRLEEGQ